MSGSYIAAVQDFGAVGDGTTDDTAAFQDAFDLCADILVPLADGQKYRITDRAILDTSRQRIISDVGGPSTMEGTNHRGYIDCSTAVTGGHVLLVQEIGVAFDGLAFYGGDRSVVANDAIWKLQRWGASRRQQLPADRDRWECGQGMPKNRRSAQ